MMENEEKSKIKIIIEENFVLEQKNIALRKENSELSIKLEKCMLELQAYKECHNQMIQFLKNIESAYTQNRMLDMCEMIAGLIGRENVSHLKISDLESVESNFYREINIIRNKNVELCNYCKNHKKIYIYGAGKKAKRLAEVLKKCGLSFEAFVVSDGQMKPDMLLSHDVVYFHDIIPQKNNIGLIIGLNPDNATEIYSLLEENGMRDYFYFK